MNNLLLAFSEIDFGEVSLTPEQKRFRNELNDEIIYLCKSLPESTRTDALLLLLRELKTPKPREIDFVGYYYVPTWSIVYWLCVLGSGVRGLAEMDIKNAKTAHSMAMFLHAFDDHLNDNELPATHLTLLLRSQAWMIMQNALNSLSDGVEGGRKIVQEFIDSYYSGIRTSASTESLNAYCDLFKKQMATGFIVPVLVAKKVSEDRVFAGRIQSAFGSFGIAWRLLDDIKDIETDIVKRNQSAVYVCLPEKIKFLWNKHTGENTDERNKRTAIILDMVSENRVFERIRQRICRELESAASIADGFSMTGLADEFRCLLAPLKTAQEYA